MMDTNLIKNYYISLNQKYNAICFDIDGTLTKTNSTKIDKRILPIIANILKRHVPIVFITGRGETGLTQLKDEIVTELKNSYKVNNKHLQQLYALTNDGARIFLTSSNSKDIFNINEYISSPIDIEKLKKMNNQLLQELKRKHLLKYCAVTYSKDKKNNTIINIRISVSTSDKIINDKIINIVNDLISKSNSENINLTIGIYNGKQILQIGTAIKSKAIEVTEKIIGIPQNSMLRVGDCGNEIGNDYSMLNCPQGFTVDKRSHSNSKCFPILDQNQKVLKGVDATISLLNQVKLIPTICLEHATKNSYTKAYSSIEKRMNLGKNKRIGIFNDIINQKFESIDGIYSLYDKFSGSVKIPMYEWICINDENPLKQLWNKNNQSCFNYAMYDNENILLRGSKTYYYFLANRFHNNKTGEDITSKEMIKIWLYNYKIFYIEAKDSIIHSMNLYDLNDLNNSKMILGILDNMRNELLILLNQQIIYKNPKQSLLINLEKLDNNDLIKSIYNTLLSIVDMMKSISFDYNYKINANKVLNLINNSITITENFRRNFENQEKKENYSKDFRAYREIDNFAENYITCYLTMKNNDSLFHKGICGISYGGIELPIIMKSIDNRINDVSILKFNKNVTGYSKKQSLNLRFFNIFQAGGIEQIGITKDKKYILLDDNLLTGKTMQLALTSFFDLGIDVDKIIVVRYPGVNRISQMFMPNHGAIDYKCFFDFIQGLYFPSPYSWRDTHSSDPYEDSLGVFDLNRRKIIECLIKNGDYSTDSEVRNIKRMIKK